MGKPAGVEKEPHNAQNLAIERRVEFMIGALKKYNPVFILVALPTDSSSSNLYVAFKRYFEMRIGVISQCMIKPRQFNPQYLWNLVLKINQKMEGFNSPLTSKITSCLGGAPTIIFGIDVSHGSIGENFPSVAAVVATKNWPDVFHFATRAGTQQSKLKLIEGLWEPKSAMVKDLLLEFHRTCRGPVCKPSQVTVHRDGVREGRFADCLKEEVNAFKRVCRDIQEDYNPGITFIVVQKRHNTRFFSQSRDT